MIVKEVKLLLFIILFKVVVFMPRNGSAVEEPRKKNVLLLLGEFFYS